MIINEEVEQLKNTSIYPAKLGFVSKNGFNITYDNDYILITLDDIYDFN